MESYIHLWPTVNDRLNALGVYLKSTFYPGRLFEHGRLFGRAVYLLVVPVTYLCYSKNVKISRVLLDELQKKKMYQQFTLNIVLEKIGKYPYFKT